MLSCPLCPTFSERGEVVYLSPALYECVCKCVCVCLYYFTEIKPNYSKIMPVFHSDPWGVCIKYITSTPCTVILSAVTASLFYLYGSSKAQVSETKSSYY